MSLLTTASVWNNDDTGNYRRKASSSVKKMIKNMGNGTPAVGVDSGNRTHSMGGTGTGTGTGGVSVGVSNATEESVYTGIDSFRTENYQNINEQSSSITQTLQSNQDRNTRVQQLLDQMSADNDGNRLADFNPISRPQVMKKTDTFEGKTSSYELKPDDLLPNHPANHLKSKGSNMNLPNYRSSPFSPDDSSCGKLSNYNKIYDPKMVQPVVSGERPYYAKMGIDSMSMGGAMHGGVDSKLLEKINYLIH